MKKSLARLAELYTKQAAASHWGAAVGARHEEIKSLEGRLAAMDRTPSPAGARDALDIRSLSQSTKDDRCLEVWFARAVTDADRANLLAAINAASAPHQSSGVQSAAERVCWFDWSGNDPDAVAAIDALRSALSSQSGNSPDHFREVTEMVLFAGAQVTTHTREGK